MIFCFIYLFNWIRLIINKRVNFSCLVLFYLLDSNINLFVCVRTPFVVFNQGNSTLFFAFYAAVLNLVCLYFYLSVCTKYFYLWVCTKYCFCVIFLKVAITTKGSSSPLQEACIFRLTDIVLLGAVIYKNIDLGKWVTCVTFVGIRGLLFIAVQMQHAYVYHVTETFI